MNAAYVGVGAAMLGLGAVFLARAGKARQSKLAGTLFMVAGLAFMAAAIISMFNRD